MNCRAPYLPLLLVGGALTCVSHAQILPPQFTLPRYVPEDLWMFVASTHTSERVWVEDRIGEVLEALGRSGVGRDITALFLTVIPEADRAEAQAALDRLRSLTRGVRWRDLAAREFVFAESVGTTMPGYGYLFLARGTPQSVDANLTALVAILEELASLSAERNVERTGLGDVQRWRVTVDQTGRVAFPFNIDLFRKGDVIGLGVGAVKVDDVLALMSGKGKTRSIVASSRFREAMACVRPPEHRLVFFDARTLLASVIGLLDRALIEYRGIGQASEAKVRALRRFFDFCDVFDYSITTMEMKGPRELLHSVSVMQPGKQDNPFVRACFKRQPFAQVDQYVPAEATAFRVSGGVDLGELYGATVGFVDEYLPGGADLLARWRARLASYGLDPQRDVFDWWSGETIVVKMPPKMPGPFGTEDAVFMIRVKDPELASRKVNAAGEFIKAKSQETGQMFRVSPARVRAGGFYEITHPAMTMFLRPVIGVHDEWLMIGTSAAAVDKCLDVAKGRAPSIMKNPRYLGEGLVPAGPVLSASFTDRSNYGRQLGEMVSLVGMVAGGVSTYLATVPWEGEAEVEMREVSVFLSRLSTVLTKLGPVLHGFDFYRSESAVTVVEGLTFRKERVVTYKGPPSRDETGAANAPRIRR